MNITSNDILDSLMRVALRPEIRTATDMSGNTMSFQEPSVMQPIVQAICEQIRNEPELKASIVAQIIHLIPDMVPALQKKLLSYIVEEHTVSGGYGSGSHTKAVIAKWAEPEIQLALAEALRAKIEEQIPTDLPLERYDITVNMVPK